jgi:hypothetical protein
MGQLLKMWVDVQIFYTAAFVISVVCCVLCCTCVKVMLSMYSTAVF